mmetsp:Transcript_33211/g.87750  ORF Transcript_33211/g.87750 Transcript_33211/m.87750 type:complete len:211 (-) Transcript_33211:200-832(-)
MRWYKRPRREASIDPPPESRNRLKWIEEHSQYMSESFSPTGPSASTITFRSSAFSHRLRIWCVQCFSRMICCSERRALFTWSAVASHISAVAPPASSQMPTVAAARLCPRPPSARDRNPRPGVGMPLGAAAFMTHARVRVRRARARGAALHATCGCAGLVRRLAVGTPTWATAMAVSTTVLIGAMRLRLGARLHGRGAPFRRSSLRRCQS